jgi:hypothetical protein
VTKDQVLMETFARALDVSKGHGALAAQAQTESNELFRSNLVNQMQSLLLEHGDRSRRLEHMDRSRFVEFIPDACPGVFADLAPRRAEKTDILSATTCGKSGGCRIRLLI